MKEETEESLEDAKITTENIKLLSLSEHPVWGTFVKMVAGDMLALDSISSLDMENKSRDEIAREVEIRYHTIKAVESALVTAIERANTAKEEAIEESDSIIQHH